MIIPFNICSLVDVKKVISILLNEHFPCNVLLNSLYHKFWDLRFFSSWYNPYKFLLSESHFINNRISLHLIFIWSGIHFYNWMKTGAIARDSNYNNWFYRCAFEVAAALC